MSLSSRALLYLYLLVYSCLSLRLVCESQTFFNPVRDKGAKPFSKLVAERMETVAFISTEEGTGSGFYVSTQGYVITARHVVHLQSGALAKDIKVEIKIPAQVVSGLTLLNNSQRTPALVIAEDEEHDLALLKPSMNPLNVHVIQVGGKDVGPKREIVSLCREDMLLQAGDPIFTIGHPLGDSRRVTTAGIVASSEPITTDHTGELQGTYLVDILINHGNSGGPVFSTADGCVIGVADAIGLRPVEAQTPEGRALPPPKFNLSGPDGKPLIGEDGLPIAAMLEYSTGLGILVPQQYVLKLMRKAGLN